MYSTFYVFDELLGMRNWFDRYFNEIPSERSAIEYPYVNLYENGDDIEIKVVAPGINGDDLNIQLIDNTLYIEGEKKDDYVDKSYIRKERDFGKFRKAVKLPYKVDSNKIEAGMKEGILTIKLVKSEEAKPKKIEIH
jgi:HSP20 family protein